MKYTCHLPNSNWITKLGSIGYYLIPIKRKIIETNISNVLGSELSQKSRTDLIKAIYGRLICFPFGIIRDSLRSLASRRKSTHVKNLHIVEEALKKKKGALWVTCHLGNWEVAFVNFMLKHPEYKNRVSLIRKPLNPSWLNSFIVNRYTKVGIDVLPPEKGSLKQILKKLKNNEIVLFVLDQHASSEKATTATFFGHKVQFTKSLARLAIQTEAPIIPTATWQNEKGEHVCEFDNEIPAIEKNETKTLEEIVQESTQLYNHSLEKFILQHPDQWFCWAHRLWKASLRY